MSTINQELLDLLHEKFSVGKTQVYWHVSRKCEETSLPRDQAAIAVAMELGIEVHKYATEYDLECIYKVAPGLRPLIKEMLPTKKQIAEGIELSQKNAPIDPFMDNKLISAAHRNGEVCVKFFLFENSIRHVVHAVMEKEFGIDWWYDQAPRELMYNTFDRRSGEKEPKWRGQFGAEPIYYTDTKDLMNIIESNKDKFNKYLGNSLDIGKWIDIIERVRTSLSYANPVTRTDRDKFMSYVEHWNKVANRVYKQLNG